tara:strand:+ start:712 stop:1392 length:681 start_codon:yes stop_codon:yes gene_type:complete
MPNLKNEKRLKNRFLVWLGERIGPPMLKFLYNTNKWKVYGDQHIEQELASGKSIIIASWHGTLLTVFMGLANKNYFGMAGNHHPEAEIISRVGKKLGWTVIRGSSTDGGKKAYEEMIKSLNKPGTVFAITPDGPQGPAKIPKAGAIRAAQKTGAIIIPAAGQSTKYWSFKNWDTFYLAKPFGKIVQLFGEPIILKKDDDYALCVEKLKNALNKLEKEAQSHVNMEN